MIKKFLNSLRRLIWSLCLGLYLTFSSNASAASDSVSCTATATLMSFISLQQDGDFVRWSSNSTDAIPPTVEIVRGDESVIIELAQQNVWVDVITEGLALLDAKKEEKREAIVLHTKKGIKNKKPQKL